MNDSGVTRRESMVAMGAAVGGLIAGSAGPQLATAAAPSGGRKRALRVAHLTDIHVEPEKRAGDGMAVCLRHVNGLSDRPGLIVTGGDSVFDSFGADDARTTELWNLWTSVLKKECSIEVKSCIGNHDVWGWAKEKSKTTGKEPNWGKQRAIDMLKLPDRYYTFQKNGWQFIVLDSMQPAPAGFAFPYKAMLDEAQFKWLEKTLADIATNVPVFVTSHIPIMSVTPILWASAKDPNPTSSGWLMHADSEKLKTLFSKHPNVKICVSGHTHLVDRVDYNGVSYMCNGAVCGNWWRGRHKDCDEGYAVLDLYDDGSFDHRYVRYGWKADAT